jgi:hypothetical protein
MHCCGGGCVVNGSVETADWIAISHPGAIALWLRPKVFAGRFREKSGISHYVVLLKSHLNPELLIPMFTFSLTKV